MTEETKERCTLYSYDRLNCVVLEELATLNRAAFAEYAGKQNFRGVTMTADALYESMRETGQTAFILQVDNRVAAYCRGYISETPEGKCLHDEGDAVHPMYQGRGYAKVVVRLREQWGKENGAVYAELSTSVKAKNAIGFHRACGYRKYGYVYYQGKNYLSVVMRKYFETPMPESVRLRRLIKSWFRLNLVYNKNGRKRIWIRLKKRLIG